MLSLILPGTGRGTICHFRQMVEGACHKRNDRIRSGVRIRKHALCRNMHDAKAIFPKKRIARRIAIRPTGAIMRFAVDLDDGRHRRAVKIHDIRPNRMLPPKLQPRLLPPQPLP
ncbi:hypothetical protein J2X47_003284 [Sphingomonas sp. BE270]|jgi:hypothetical protein|nr:hypothetical protein [Sphingomonas sp. BE137]MDR7259088.1 hypothetical protein [Sphingomonas sp. BE270]